jgi:acetone carboxylase gamma subunit
MLQLPLQLRLEALRIGTTMVLREGDRTTARLGHLDLVVAAPVPRPPFPEQSLDVPDIEGFYSGWLGREIP